MRYIKVSIVLGLSCVVTGLTRADSPAKIIMQNDSEFQEQILIWNKSDGEISKDRRRSRTVVKM